jgi:hypothetical protein
MRTSIFALSLLALSGCNSASDGSSTVKTDTLSANTITENPQPASSTPPITSIAASPSLVPFKIKTSAASIVFSSGSIADLGNGIMTVGDTSSDPKRGVVTFPLSSLTGKTLSSVKLNLYFEAQGGNIISNLGAIRAYKIAPRSSIDASAYSASELDNVSVIEAFSSFTQGQRFELDVKNMALNALSLGETYLTFKIRTDQSSGSGNTAFNFYCLYNTTTPEVINYVPNLSGELYE